MKTLRAVILPLAVSVVLALPSAAAAQNRSVGINVVLNTSITPAILADLGRFGRVLDTLEALDAVHMRAREGNLATIKALPYVAAANPDAERMGAPVDTVSASDF